VIDTVVGYTGGTTAAPTYESIGDHTEALRVTFDPRRLTLDQIFTQFWRGHTPMPVSFTGSQYRSAIFCHGDSQRRVAEFVRSEIAGDSPFASETRLTAIEPASPFYRAEEYHQRFISKQRRGAIPWSPAI